MKRIQITSIILVSIIVIFGLGMFGIYQFIDWLIYQESFSQLPIHAITENEKIIRTFDYDGFHYMITKYYDDTSSWSHLNILLQNQDHYYLLQNIMQCDTLNQGENLYIKDNQLYIHCIGKPGNIDQYSFDGVEVKHNVLNFDYENTPDISEIHLIIDGIDSDFIYLSANQKIKCYLKDKSCQYVR